MPTLEEYFSDERITNQLCKERVKLAESRHDRQYISRLTGHLTETVPNHIYYRLMPPRRAWSAFRPRYRHGGLNPDLIALKKAVRVLRHQYPEPQWVAELNRYINAVRERMLNDQPFTFSSPTIRPVLKKKGEREYRALCRFNQEDNLILCLYAQYLRDAFDSLFSCSSYAFRAAKDGQIPTHHQAFTEVYNLKHHYGNRNLHVCECDIKGFFDTVDHGVALAAFQDAARKVNLHPRAEQIFRAYLNCYSFPANVLVGAGAALNGRGYFKWPEKELAILHKTDPHSLRIGVAQGGAVSGIIANLILDAADKSVEAVRERSGKEIHYYRYCDDMLLISPNLKDCKAAFQAYLTKLTELKLAFHLPETTCIYGKGHWKHKSKAPYCWSGRQWFWCVPWVQFVGYQIRYDGLVRPRKDSVKKQCDKLVETTDNLKFSLIRVGRHKQVQASRRQALASLKAKLTAQGVGRVKNSVVGPRPMCWASGYRALHQKAFVPNFLSTFDQTRRKQIGRFARTDIPFGLGNRSRSAQRREVNDYWLSYHAQFTNNGGLDLIRNPWRPGNLKEQIEALLFTKWKVFLRKMFYCVNFFRNPLASTRSIFTVTP